MTQNLYQIPVKSITGDSTTLAPFEGKVLLVVNVASKCGLTPQYEGLEKLYEAKRAEGLEVLGFPANNFNEQEPGSEAEIQEFCSLNYSVQFPLFAKISVVGSDKHPLYQALTTALPDATGEGPMREKLLGYGITANPAPEVQWNFEKFLIGRDGQVVARFAPDVTADDPRMVEAVEKALKAGV
ncbi:MULTISPECIES: glutathione peroxidase [unclassified Pseudomonas]|uniref:glutathione peroxidase n=1 Tax=unclassified Pseudomonas TaxID=196821 RepID=UPI002AC8DCB7|nr:MULTISPECIES: glutathione peroxidase [unclassified Pseudomonas]MEB0040170.1 glutathione peroxidase [Pseudomonas sp. MH10]MEB0078867.1 glutathione peroxidase [Pseudomonas sp. MH10out]MEB0090094.1 glutathione peroxidase [Pseudomonas sp. CCI4.2]MEB0102069.1 glutathione peroxidase [Pseudomonas sp. CCI3.2]MEB0122491.1 glutathione peroxidase [Pseudomonas sp. CCI1.2]